MAWEFRLHFTRLLDLSSGSVPAVLKIVPWQTIVEEI
ncbi:MAG: hypothetical protein ALAOOOJD_01698 [bacterium]|nr:hypothetical protein [bacterium]